MCDLEVKGEYAALLCFFFLLILGRADGFGSVKVLLLSCLGPYRAEVTTPTAPG